MTEDRVITTFRSVARSATGLLSAAWVRRIIVRNTEDSVIIQAPLPVAFVVTIVALPIVAVGAVTALVLRYTLSIEQQTTNKQNQALERKRTRRAV